MNKKIKIKIIRATQITISVIVALVALYSTVFKVADFSSMHIFGLTFNKEEEKEEEEKTDLNILQSEIDRNDDKESQNVEETQPPTQADLSGLKQYPVIETSLGTAGETTLKNTTNYTFDIEKQAKKPLGFEIEDTQEPQVLIVHTHASESFLTQDNGYYYENYTSRSLENDENIVSVGEILANTLNDRGIVTLQSTVHHDSPTYSGSYDRSQETIYQYLEEFPSIKVVLDVHRDALGYGGEDGKYKPTFTYDGKKAAQIMIMTGYDPDGTYGYEDWTQNLTFALKLNETAQSLYPGMTRPLYFGNFAYNMFINSGSLLIEVGTDANTLEEAQYTALLLGDVIAQVLSE